MARLRYNGLTATLGAALTSSATAVTFGAALTYNGAAATAVPTIVSPDYIPLTILDSSGNVSEIVWLTAYTSGATTGTISRAQEGTPGVAHNSGDRVVHGPTRHDIRQPGCQAKCTTAQAIPNSSLTAITLDTEEYDTDGYFDAAANPTRITVPAGQDGKYMVVGQVGYVYNSSGNRSCTVRKNGATLLYDESTAASVSSTKTGTFMADLVAGDYLELMTFQNSGASRTLDTSAANRLTVQRLSS